MSEQVEIGGAPEPQANPPEVSPTEPEATPSPEGDSLILGKFKSQEDLETAYKALEARLGSQNAPEVVPSPNEPVPQQKSLDELMAAATEEFSGGEGLADGTYDAFEAAGVSRDKVDAFIAGQTALQEKARQTFFDAVGGQELYDAARAWAQENLTADEISRFNDQIQGEDTSVATLAGRGLVAMYTSANPQGELLGGKPPRISGLEPFANQEQWIQAIQDPRYDKDPAWRDQVEARLKVSQF